MKNTAVAFGSDDPGITLTPTVHMMRREVTTLTNILEPCVRPNSIAEGNKAYEHGTILQWSYIVWIHAFS